MYRIAFAKEAHKTLIKIPRNTASLIRQKLELVASDPYGDYLNAKKLQDRPGYRLRIGDWRVIYEIHNEELIILVLKIAPAWRNLSMNPNIQIIERDGKPEWAVIPYEIYVRLAEEAEMLQDIQAYDAAKAALDCGDEELIPSTVTFAILDGENPIKVWRAYRGLTQQQLAATAGISVSYLSQLESNKRTGSTDVLLAIAQALKVTLDDLVQPVGTE